MRTLALLFILAFPSVAFAVGAVKEGLWEISLQGEMGGQSLSSTPLVVRQCLNSRSVQDLMAQLNGVGGGGCQVSDFLEEAGRARWSMNCTGPVTLSGTGEVMIGQEAFNGTMSMLVAVGGQTVPLLQTFNARWVGDCK